MRISTDFTSARPGSPGDPVVYNANLAKIEEYINDALAYLEQFVNDLSGDGIGRVSGGALTDGGGLVVDVSALTAAWVGGERISSVATTVNVPDDSTTYIYVNQNGEYVIDSAFAFYTNRIPIGKVTTVSGSITAIVQYNNTVFTMKEMALQRLMPMGLLVTNDGVNTIINVSYLDPDVSGLETITIEASDDDGATWVEIATVGV